MSSEAHWLSKFYLHTHRHALTNGFENLCKVIHMKINNNLGSKILKNYNDGANHNLTLDHPEHAECLCNYPQLFYLRGLQVDQKIFTVKVSMTDFL